MRLQDPSLLRQQAFVAGKWTDADNGTTYPVIDPASRETLAAVPRLGATETRRAIEAAERAFKTFRRTTAAERAKLLFAFEALLRENRDDLALLMTHEQGKPLTEARGEVAYAANFLRWFGEEARRNYGSVIPSPNPDTRMLVWHEPVGVCAGITPWNFPAAMITRKLGAALAAGCTMLIKPAEATPLTALALGELATRAGLPEGVLSVLTGDRADAAAIGKELTGHATVRKLSFTGSTAVGKLLAEQCASTVKRVSLELGGNAPFIVFEDADLDAALDGLMACKFRNSGQTCVSANRILVQDGVYDAFSAKLAERMAALSVGPGVEDRHQIGPLINEQAMAKVQSHVSDATGKGAKLRLGGKAHSLGGTFYEPTLLEEVSPDMTLCHEETFGPVAGLLRFQKEEQAIQLANDTPSGLAAYFYARDVGRAFRVSEALEYGMVGANAGIVSTEVAPFGGVKESGLGREGSQYGLDDWMELKYVCMGGMKT